VVDAHGVVIAHDDQKLVRGDHGRLLAMPTIKGTKGAPVELGDVRGTWPGTLRGDFARFPGTYHAEPIEVVWKGGSWVEVDPKIGFIPWAGDTFLTQSPGSGLIQIDPCASGSCVLRVDPECARPPFDSRSALVSSTRTRLGDDILVLTSTCLLRYAPHALDAERLPVPDGVALYDVFDVGGRSRDDLYLSGWKKGDAEPGFHAPFIVHFDGHAWSRVAQPPDPPGHWRLAGFVQGGLVVTGTRRIDPNVFPTGAANDTLEVFDETAHEWCNVALPQALEGKPATLWGVVGDGDGVWIVTSDGTNAPYEAFYATAVRAGGH